MTPLYNATKFIYNGVFLDPGFMCIFLQKQPSWDWSEYFEEN